MTTALRVESHPPVIGYGALWFGILAAPLAWSLLLVVNYAMAAQSCAPEGMVLNHPLFASVRLFEGMLSLVALAIAVAGLVTAIRNRVVSSNAEVPHDVVWNRVHFMSLFGIVVSALFVNGIVLHGLGVVLIPLCW
ncbi:MAG TPA: hypothetical protein VFW98_18355 [Gemmatimonadaceae bacterium]|nr:hypothetical protein [Gemmatimonadaceae bacterium]